MIGIACAPFGTRARTTLPSSSTVIGLDTNVLLRLWLNDDAAQAPRVEALLSEHGQGMGSLLVTDVVLAEALNGIAVVQAYLADPLVHDRVTPRLVRFIVDGVTVADVPVVTANLVPAENSMWSRAVDSVFIMVFGS